jgi:hypothetical protein
MIVNHWVMKEKVMPVKGQALSRTVGTQPSSFVIKIVFLPFYDWYLKQDGKMGGM